MSVRKYEQWADIRKSSYSNLHNLQRRPLVRVREGTHAVFVDSLNHGGNRARSCATTPLGRDLAFVSLSLRSDVSHQGYHRLR